MPVERTLVLVKPDAIQRGLGAEVLARLERRGLRLVGLKLIQIDRGLAERHYAIHRERPFFAGLVDFITSGPVIAAVLEGLDAVVLVRNTMGATNPRDAAPGTIRGDLAVEIGHNLIHGSDSTETAATEVALFFRPEEILDYRRAIDPWVADAKSP